MQITDNPSRIPPRASKHHLARWLAFAFFAFLAFAQPPAQASLSGGDANPQRSAAYFESASEYFSKGEYEASIIELKNALQENPENLPARVLLGRAYLQAYEAANAEQELLTAREFGADSSLIIVPLAQAYLQQRKFRTLLDTVFAAGYAPRIDAELNVLRGNAHFELGEFEEAEKAYADALQASPEHPGALLGQALLRLNAGDWEAGQALAEAVTGGDPANPEGWYVLGQIHQAKGEWELAIAAFDKAITLLPNHLLARTARAVALIKLNRDEEAIADLEYVRQTDPFDPNAAYLHSMALARRNDAAGAKAALDTAAQILGAIDPEVLASHPPSLLLAGIVQFQRKETEQARRYLSQLLSIRPNQHSARKYLGTIYLSKGEYNEAVRVLEPAINFTRDPAIYALLGSAYAALGHYSSAREIYEIATELDPTQAGLRMGLAQQRLSEGGDLAEAIEDVNAVLSLDPDDQGAQFLLGSLQQRAENFPAALDAAEKVLKAEPDNVAAMTLAGSALVGSEDYAGARKWFEAALKAEPGYTPALFNLATLEWRVGNHTEAKAGYQKILEIEPDHVSAMTELGKIAAFEEDPDEAIRWLEKVRLTDPSATAQILTLVEFYLQMNEPETALEVIKDLEVRNPSNLDALMALARVELILNRIDDAKQTLSRMSRLAGYDAPRLSQIARYQTEANDLEGAQWSLAKAAQAEPDAVAPQIELIEAEIRLGNLERALDLASRVVEQFPESTTGHLMRGDVYLAMGQPDLALANYTRAHEMSADTNTVLRLYRVLRSREELTEGISLLEEWMVSHSNDATVYRALAGAYVEDGRLKQAMAAHEKLAQVFPNDAQLLNNLALLYLEFGDERALAVAERANQAAPGQAALLDTLGWILVNQGEPLRGLTHLRDAHARSGNTPEIRYHIAVALNRLGRKDEALTELTAAVAGNQVFDGIDEARVLLAELQARE